jgi:hypothetical protein
MAVNVAYTDDEMWHNVDRMMFGTWHGVGLTCGTILRI